MSRRVRRTHYHVLGERWMPYLILWLCAIVCTQSCAGASRGIDETMARRSNWVKPRVDVWLLDSREYVLIARYAELVGDEPRAAAALHRAWCIDPGARWLQEKHDAWVQRGVIDEHARCLPAPPSSSY